MAKYIYDIRSSECAAHTLVDITGVPLAIWVQHLDRERDYEYLEDLVGDAIRTYGHFPQSYQDFDFVFFHVTTSANQCASYFRDGLMGLKSAYLNKDSELRAFLDQHDIQIDLEEQILAHSGKRYDITYGPRPRSGTQSYFCWSVGRKFYYDYTVCGFLSVWEQQPYGGQVHRRPEILDDIDNLLNLNLSREWECTHTPYEINAKINGKYIVYDGDDTSSEEDKVIDFLTRAYITAFGEPSLKVLLLQNGIRIPPSDIIEIKPLSHWLNR